MVWFIPALVGVGAASSLVNTYSKKRQGYAQRRQAWDQYTMNYLKIQKEKEYKLAVSTRYATGGQFVSDIYNDANSQHDYIDRERQNLFRRISSWEGGAFSFFLSLGTSTLTGYLKGVALEESLLAQQASKIKNLALLSGSSLSDTFVKNVSDYNTEKQFAHNINASMELSRRSISRTVNNEDLLSRQIVTGGELV